MQYPSPGPNFVPEYQVSGMPFTTASSGNGVVSFPYVTQWVMVRSTGSATTAKFGFTVEGLNANNFFTVGTTFSEPLRWKIKELWVSGSSGFEVVAGLTTVDPIKMWTYVHPPASGSYFPTASYATANFNEFGYNGI